MWLSGQQRNRPCTRLQWYTNCQAGFHHIKTRHAHKCNVCLSLCLFYTNMSTLCTHSCQFPSLAWVLYFFPPSTQWHPAVGRDITEKQGEERGKVEEKKGVKEKGTLQWDGDCRGKRERFKRKRLWGWALGAKRLSKWWSERRPCEWFPQCHEGNMKAALATGERAAKKAWWHTSDESDCNWSAWEGKKSSDSKEGEAVPNTSYGCVIIIYVQRM